MYLHTNDFNINELKNEFYSDWLASDRLCVFYKGGVSGREPRTIWYKKWEDNSP